MAKFTDLPADIHRLIALKLNLRQIFKLSISCKSIYQDLCGSDEFWRHLYRRDLSINVPAPYQRSIRETYQNHILQIKPMNSYSTILYLTQNRLELKLAEMLKITNLSPDEVLYRLTYLKENNILETVFKVLIVVLSLRLLT